MTSLDLAVEQWVIERVKPFAQNVRLHPQSQVRQLARSITDFGFNVPCLVNEQDELISGHGRLLAARSLGMPKIPVIRLSHLTPGQVRAFRLADNQIALNADWDMAGLQLELGALREVGVDLGCLGFSASELGKLLGNGKGLTDADALPNALDFEVSKSGDIWILGSHRLLCGDSTSEADVKLLLGSERPHLMVTDPPYGVNYDPNWRNTSRACNTDRLGKVLNDHQPDWGPSWKHFHGDVAYVWHAALFANVVGESLVSGGFAIRSQIIWAKERLVLSRGDYHWRHEPCFYAVRKGASGHWAGDRAQTTLWEISSTGQDTETAHGTQKPVECMRRPMENNSQPDDAVYEPFSGSGTTLIAAEQTGRRCLAMELSPVYVDMAVQRWQNFTGKTAIHADNNQTFDDIRLSRGASNGRP